MKTKLYLFIYFLFAISVIHAQQNTLNIVSSGNGFTIQFTLPEYELRDTSFVNLFNTQEVFKYIRIDDFGIVNDMGYPQLPQLTFDLPLAQRASDFQVTLSNMITEEINIDSRLLPTQGDLRNIPSWRGYLSVPCLKSKNNYSNE